MKLSPHFSLYELTKSGTAVRLGIDNTPSDVEIYNLTLLCNNILEPIRVNFGIPFSPSSGYRCIKLNRILGSKDTSDHVNGYAADIEIPTVDNIILYKWCKSNLNFNQLILEYYKEGNPRSGWIHISYISTKINKMQAFRLG